MSSPHEANKDGIFVSLDIGSTKVTVLIAQAKLDGVDIIGVGNVPHQAVKQGTIVHIEAVTDAIKKAKEEAELMAGFSVNSCYIGVPSIHNQQVSSKGMVAITHKEVKKEDVNRVIEAAKIVKIPADHEVLHVLPREYTVDNQSEIKNPVGMTGVRLEAQVEIVTASKKILTNLNKCTEMAGFKTLGFVSQSLASAKAILTDSDYESGVAVVDIGGGTCDVVCYSDTSFFSMSTVTVGGINFTQDVAVGLRAPQLVAEEVKKKYGAAIADLIDETETIEVETVGGRGTKQILRRFLGEILEARSEETFSLILQALSQVGAVGKLGSGIVLTGGGSQLYGLVELGEYTFDIPVRRGIPESVNGLKEAVKQPQFATAVGILLMVKESHLPKPKTVIDKSMSWWLDQWDHLKEYVGKSLN